MTEEANHKTLIWRGYRFDDIDSPNGSAGVHMTDDTPDVWFTLKFQRGQWHAWAGFIDTPKVPCVWMTAEGPARRPTDLLDEALAKLEQRLSEGHRQVRKVLAR